MPRAQQAASAQPADVTRSRHHHHQRRPKHACSRWQPGHQVTITVSHPDYVNLSRLYRGRLANLTELPEHLTRLRQRHNVPGTIIHTQLRYR
jgi:hypothetical protein